MIKKLLVSCALGYCSVVGAQTTPPAQVQNIKCTPGGELIVGETIDGAYIGWWCSHTEYTLYAATWKWMTYANKQKLIPLVKKDVTTITLEEFAKINAVTPASDPTLSRILSEGRTKLMSIRPARPVNPMIPMGLHPSDPR